MWIWPPWRLEAALSSGSTLGWPGRVAIAIVRSDPSQFFLAENDAVLGRLLALRLVARTSSDEFSERGLLKLVRTALLEERWADAVRLWMDATDQIVDAYPDEEVATEERLDEDHASVEIRLAPIFEDPPSDER